MHTFAEWIWLFLWCLTPLSTIFQLYSYYCGSQFYWWRKTLRFSVTLTQLKDITLKSINEPLK